MAVTIIATPGDPDANSYESVVEANDYFDTRIPLTPPWNTDADTVARTLITGTRAIDALATGRKRLVRPTSGDPYYVVGRKWTGTPATSTQALAWPRIGMFDRNGNAIPSDVIPKELKEALSEFAGRLQHGDPTLDNAVAIQGITSVQAGSVSVSFKDGVDPVTVISQMVLALMPASWFTEETIEGASNTFDFTVVGTRWDY